MIGIQREGVCRQELMDLSSSLTERRREKTNLERHLDDEMKRANDAETELREAKKQLQEAKESQKVRGER